MNCTVYYSSSYFSVKMSKIILALVLGFLFSNTLISFANGARILVIFTLPFPSHFFLGKALVKELVNRKHDVTFINSFGAKLDSKNFKEVLITRNETVLSRLQTRILEMHQVSDLDRLDSVLKGLEYVDADTMKEAEIQRLLKSSAKFDLVILQSLFSEAQVGFAHHYNCPLIVFSTVGSNIWSNYFVRNQAPVSFVPHVYSGLSGRMSFWQRVRNFLLTCLFESQYYMYHLPKQEVILHKYFPTAPSLDEVIRERTALVLLNSHPSISMAKPTMPNMVEIGGFHISEPKPLPSDLQNYLDEADHGFILFSMGSALKSAKFSNETLGLFMKVFRQLPYKILWKFEEDHMPDKPLNVKIAKWLPQNDVLAHPNLKLFITHGGHSSTIEAVYHGVPILGIPVFGDQEMNMAVAESLGIGKTVPFKILNSKKLLVAIRELLSNDTYRKAVKFRSAVFRDQPMRPIDTAMYWIEHVLRYKNMNYLMTEAIHLNWYQIYSLDVLTAIGTFILLVAAVFYVTIKKTVSSIKEYLYEQSKCANKKVQ